MPLQKVQTRLKHFHQYTMAQQPQQKKDEHLNRRSRIDLEVKELEEELSKTKYNKKTQHHIGLVKAKLARLKERKTTKSGTGKADGFSVRKTGDGTVVLL